MAKQNSNPIKDIRDQMMMESFNKPQSLAGISQNARTNFNPTQANMSRYLTYGSKIYGKLGFDPTRDNNTFYNQHTTAGDDIARGFEGMFKLAKIGFQDTFAFGATKDKNSSFEFEKTMNDYSSTRGGGAQLFSNTLLSSGYTAGILSAIAAEEVLLTGITALTGGAGAGVQVAESGLAVKRGGELLKVLDKIDEARKIEKSRSFFGKMGEALNPFSNTVDFVKGAYKSDKLSSLTKLAVGSGAFARDMRSLYMTHSESKLEAEMAEREFFNSEYEKALGKSDSGVLDQQTISQIKDRAKRVGNSVYVGNLGLIYATNAIAFDNMFKTMKGVNRYFNQAGNGYKTVINKATGAVTVSALEKPLSGVKKAIIEKITPFGNWKSGVSSVLRGSLSASMEGIQELGQDMLSEASQSYFSKHREVEQMKGGFLNQTVDALKTLTDSDFLVDDLGEAGKGMISAKGLETFLSGALMGAFSSPVGLATQGVNSFLFEGGAQKLKEQLTQNEAYVKSQSEAFRNRQAKAKLLTEFFNNTKSFTQFMDNPAVIQQELQSEMMDAAADKDQMKFKNAQERSFAEGIWGVLEAGLHDEYKNHLTSTAENYTIDELKQVFAREDITEQNANEFRQKIRDNSQKVDEYKKVYDEVQSSFANPVNLQGVDRSTPEFMDKFLEWKSWDSLRKQVVVSTGALRDNIKRVDELNKSMSDFVTGEDFKISQLHDMGMLNSEIQALDSLVKAQSEMKLTGDQKKEFENSKNRLLLLSEYKAKVDEFNKALNSGNDKSKLKARSELKKAFIKLNDINTRKVNKDKLEDAFSNLTDLFTLTNRSEKLKSHVDEITGITTRKSWVEARAKIYKAIEDNKEELINTALEEYELKRESDDMLNALYAEGLFFDLRQLDELIKDGQMPDKIFDVSNNKLATQEQKIKAQEIIGRYIEKLKNLDLVEHNRYDSNKSGKRYKSDKRTSSDLLSELGINLDESVDLGSSEGKELLKAVIDSGFVSTADEEIINTYLKENIEGVNLKFVSDQNQAISYDSDTNTYTIDIRFAGSEYKVSQSTSLESLISRVLTEALIAEKFDESSNGLLTQAMGEIKSLLQSKLPNVELSVFENPKEFISEVLNSVQFQELLDGLSLTTAVDEESVWDDMYNGIIEMMDSKFEGKALQKVLGLIRKSFEGTVQTKEESTSNEEVIIEKSKPEIDSMTLDEVRSEINSQFIKFNELVSKANNLKLRPRERKNAKKELMQLALEIESLQNKLDDLTKEDVPVTLAYNPIQKSEEFPEGDGTTVTDRFGNTMLTATMGWNNFPTQVKDILLELMYNEQVTSKTATRSEIVALLNELQTNPILQQVLTNYNNSITSKSETDQNNKSLAANQARRKEAQDFENARVKAIKRGNQIVKNTLVENMQNFLGEDFDLLTKKEIDNFVKEFSKNADSSIKFSMIDVRNYVNAKKLKIELQKERVDLEKKQNIRVNSASFGPGKYKVVNPKNNRKVEVKVSPVMVQWIKNFHPEIFAESSEVFKEKLNAIIGKYQSEAKTIATEVKRWNYKGVEDYIYNKYLTDKQLYPEVVRAFNENFKKNGLPFAIKREKKSTGLFYEIVSVDNSKGAVRSKKQKPLIYAKSTLTNYIYNTGTIDSIRNSDLLQDAIIAFEFFNHGLTKEALTNVLLGSGIPVSKRSSYLATGKKSASDSLDGLSNKMTEDYTQEVGAFMSSEDTAILQDRYAYFIQKYSSPTDALYKIANEIKNQIDELSDDSENMDNSVTDDMIDFYSTPEGEAYLKSRNDEMESYLKSTNFELSNGTFDGDFTELTSEEKALASVAIAEGAYDLETVNAQLIELKNQLSEIKRENPNDDRIPALEKSIQLIVDSRNAFLKTESVTREIAEDNSPISKAMIAIMNMLPNKGEDHFKFYESYIEPSISLNNLIALIKVYHQDTNVDFLEKEKLQKKVMRLLKAEKFNGATVVLNGELHWMTGVRGSFVIAVNSKNKEVALSYEDFVGSYEKQALEGEVVGGDNINTVVSLNQIDYIKSTFSEILDNFESDASAETKSYVQKLTEHLKTCK